MSADADADAVLLRVEGYIGDIYAMWLGARLDEQPDLVPAVDTVLRLARSPRRARETITALVTQGQEHGHP